jgi:mRNA interferase HigB
MKVHLIKERTVNDYVRKHMNLKASFNNWLNFIENADWDGINDMKETFNSADILGKSCDRFFFNIGGNNARIICSYFFGRKKVHLYINWIGTHAEYTELCDDKLQYTIDKY